MKKAEIMKFGILKVRGCTIKIPEIPEYKGDTFGCNTDQIKIADTEEGYEIQWLKLDGPDLPKDRETYICDRNILASISWSMLNRAGLVMGKKFEIDGKHCIVRMPTGSDGNPDKFGKGCGNDWDRMMDQYREENEVTHYKAMMSWCREEDAECYGRRSARGAFEPRYWNSFAHTMTEEDIGWRPVLEIFKE